MALAVLDDARSVKAVVAAYGTMGVCHGACAACSVPEVKQLAESTSTWQEPMILAIQSRLSNAGSEGLNRIVKHVSRVAFGFRTLENRRRRVRWACTRQSRRAPSRTRQLRPR
jgi:hypothetical protein